MNLLKDRYPWNLELLAKEIIEKKAESADIIESAINILSPRYIECLRLYEKNPKNRILKHNYHLLSTLYDLLNVVKNKRDYKNNEYYEIK